LQQILGRLFFGVQIGKRGMVDHRGPPFW
jgi:hypothetical protein